MRLFSFGGGVQSVAVLVAQARGLLPRDYDYFVFANVGHDSENPDTLDYIDQIVIPFAARHGIPFETVQKTRFGEPDTVYGSVMRETREIPIPVVLPSGAFGKRSCTVDFKIHTVNRWAKKRGYTHITNGIGISLDEFRRARFSDDYELIQKVNVMVRREYPLLDLRYTRQMCRGLIQSEGLPVPPKSACYFCPFQSSRSWIELRQKHPDLFKRAVELDRRVREKRADKLQDRAYLHKSRVPLDQAVADQPRLIDDDDACESGYCMT